MYNSRVQKQQETDQLESPIALSFYK